MEYVLMSEAHIEQIAALEAQCFSDPWSVNAMYSELRNPLSLWLVALDGETVAGYIGSQSALDEADMMNLAVAPDHRRQGIAENLIRDLVDKLKVNGVARLFLEVRVSNQPAICLYEKLGFSEVGRRPGYYTNPKEDALILRKEWGV